MLAIKRTKLCFLAGLILLISLSGCGGKSKSEMVFTYILPEAIQSLDPQVAKNKGEKVVLRHLFEGLCRLDETGQTTPGVAKKWESNSDYTEFTFTLRKNAMWNDGTPLTAKDFLFGIQRALDPKTKATEIADLFIIENASEINRGVASMDMLGVEALSDDVIRFRLESGYKRFPVLTAGLRFMPCNEAFFASTEGKYGLSCEHVLTNGPFNYENIYSWEKDPEKGAYLNVARASKYTGQHRASPSKLVFLMQENGQFDSGKVAALQSGVVDVAKIVESEVKEASEAGCHVITLNETVCGLLINTKDKTLQHLKLREALISTINREDVIARLDESIVEARGIVPKSVQWEGMPYRTLSENLFAPYKPEAASGVPYLLAAAEIKSNVMPSITIICLDEEDSKNLVNGIIISWNDALNNAFNLEPLSPEEFEDRIRDGNYQAALFPLASGGTTPNSFFDQFASDAAPQLMDSQSYDTLLADKTFNMESYKELEQFIMNEHVFYPFYYGHNYYAVAPGVRDLNVTTDLGPSFISAKKEDS